MELSIVIISFNTEKLLKNCLDSILKNTANLRYEIIVVDNASLDASVQVVEKLQKRFKNIKLIKNKENLGFSGANNLGIKVAKGKFILLLNSDTIIHDNLLFEMIGWMQKNPKAGIVSCNLKNKDGSLQGTGGYFPTLSRVFSWMFFLDDIPFLDYIIKPFHPMHEKSPIYRGNHFYRKERQLDWVTGAFMLIRKEVFEDVGYFDEDYFMYTEEVDLCFRAKKAGWEIWYLPNWSITHFGGASSSREFPIISEYKSVKLFYKKHFPAWQFSFLRLFLKCGALLRMVVFGLLKGKDVAKAYAKAFKLA